jgi:uncharacterized coiled-coil DUF342 family protein
MSIPQDLREMAQTFRDMTQTIRVHIKQMLERHEHDRDEGDPAGEAIEELKQAIDALKETLEELRTKF